MNLHRCRSLFALLALACSPSPSSAQAIDPASAMHWRHIGPVSAPAARARWPACRRSRTSPTSASTTAASGAPRDYGSNWAPLFDSESTGSIGAIAVAPSDPNIIYVGTGAGIIRPDLATGDGIYKSTDAGKTWTHLGLRDSQMIATIDVDPRDPEPAVRRRARPSVRPERRARHLPLDRRRQDVSEGAVQGRVHQRATTCASIRPIRTSSTPRCGSSSRASSRAARSAATGGGIFKSTDGGTTWKQLTEGLPDVIQANLAIAPSNPKVLYAMVAAPALRRRRPRRARRRRRRSLQVHRRRRALVPRGARPGRARHARRRTRGRSARIGGGDLPPIAVDPEERERRLQLLGRDVAHRRRRPHVDGRARRARRRRLPEDRGSTRTTRDILFAVADQGAVISANRGESWSNWYTQPTAAMYHVTTDNAFPYRVCGGQQDSGSACVDSRGERRRDHVPRLASGEHPGVRRWPRPTRRTPTSSTAARATTCRSTTASTGQTKQRRARRRRATPRATVYNRNVRTMPLELVAGQSRPALLRVERRLEDDRPRHELDAHQPRPHAADVGRAGQRRASTRAA